ncbi:hypothetical protein M422DRAFT_45204 [Sphaerobolus stellatus SS14]|nr:hypothetical protein M422DRAFT_45204 [Sphaerobolus stellatus SS14]
MEASTSMTTMLQAAIPGIQRTRYFSVAGLTVLIFDHLLTLSREIHLIWHTPNDTSKGAFLINRYIVTPVMIMYLYSISGNATGLGTQRFDYLDRLYWNSIDGRIQSYPVLLLMKVRRLWDNIQFITKAIMWGTVVFLIGSFTIIVLVALEILSKGLMQYNALLNICAIVKTPSLFKAFWILSTVFDSSLFAVVFWNALSRPRTENLLLAKVLYRDGILYFIVGFQLFGIPTRINNFPKSITGTSPESHYNYSSQNI